MVFFKKKKEEEENISQEALIEEAKEAATTVAGTESEKLVIELDRVKTKVEALDEFRKVSFESLARVGEEIGELRTMLIDSQKDIEKIAIESSKAADLVNTVQPDQLLHEVKKEDAKVEELKIKLEATNDFAKDLFEKIKDMKKKVDVFGGIESVVKLNNEIRDELTTIQKFKAVIEQDSDKVENIFTDVQKHFQEFSDFKTMVKEVRSGFQDLVKEFDKVKVKSQESITKTEFREMKDRMNKEVLTAMKIINDFKVQMAEFNESVTKEELEQVATLIETSKELSKKPDNLLGMGTELKKLRKDLEKLEESIDEKRVITKPKDDFVIFYDYLDREQSKLKDKIKQMEEEAKSKGEEILGKRELAELKNVLEEIKGIRDDMLKAQNRKIAETQRLSNQIIEEDRKIRELGDKFDNFIKKDFMDVEENLNELKKSEIDQKIFEKSVKDMASMIKGMGEKDISLMLAKIIARLNHLNFMVETNKKLTDSKIEALRKSGKTLKRK